MASGYLKMFKLTGDSRYKEKAVKCLDWLIENKSPGFLQYSWGNHFPFSSRGGRLPKNEPIIVWTSLIGQTFLDAYEIIGLNMYTDYQYLEDVWTKHETMVNAIADGDLDRSFDALVNHFAILATRPAGSRGVGDEVMETHTYLLTAE